MRWRKPKDIEDKRPKETIKGKTKKLTKRDIELQYYDTYKEQE